MARSDSLTTNTSAVEFLPRGALIQDFRVAGQSIVLNFPTDAAYVAHNAFYFGETIGRVANRVQRATIGQLNGQSYTLPKNNGPSSLHGGVEGWGKKVWRGPHLALIDGHESVAFTYNSPHGDEGYPGAVQATVRYVARTQVHQGVEQTVLDVSYEVRMADEQPDGVSETVVNVTNHSYFNPGPESTFDGTRATLHTDLCLPLDSDGIPTAGPTRHEYIQSGETVTLGKTQPVLDDCFILNAAPATIPLDSRSSPLQLAASFYHPLSHIHLEVRTTEPAFQFYTGDYVNVPAVHSTPSRPSRAGFCVEPGRYINAVNVDEWRSMVVLKKGETYGSRIVYTAWKS